MAAGGAAAAAAEGVCGRSRPGAAAGSERERTRRLAPLFCGVSPLPAGAPPEPGRGEWRSRLRVAHFWGAAVAAEAAGAVSCRVPSAPEPPPGLGGSSGAKGCGGRAFTSPRLCPVPLHAPDTIGWIFSGGALVSDRGFLCAPRVFPE